MAPVETARVLLPWIVTEKQCSDNAAASLDGLVFQDSNIGSLITTATNLPSICGRYLPTKQKTGRLPEAVLLQCETDRGSLVTFSLKDGID